MLVGHRAIKEPSGRLSNVWLPGTRLVEMSSKEIGDGRRKLDRCAAELEREDLSVAVDVLESQANGVSDRLSEHQQEQADDAARQRCGFVVQKSVDLVPDHVFGNGGRRRGGLLSGHAEPGRDPVPHGPVEEARECFVSVVPGQVVVEGDLFERSEGLPVVVEPGEKRDDLADLGGAGVDDARADGLAACSSPQPSEDFPVEVPGNDGGMGRWNASCESLRA
ncbi:hypothetical protein ACFFX0_32450 [Citricoccus parietis]|uniref:Uncharacterized protein n=1 Tax=Citricoccus parietis TaxID=592307 RepID=A0ABV5G9L8_9MICC